LTIKDTLYILIQVKDGTIQSLNTEETMTQEIVKIQMDKEILRLIFDGATIIAKDSADLSFRYSNGAKYEREYVLLLKLTDKQIEETKTEKHPNGFNYCWAHSGGLVPSGKFSIFGHLNMTKREAVRTLHKKLWD